MRVQDLLKLSTRMFKARTSRTLLTILGMGVGIGAILFLVSLGYGLQNVLLERITTSDALLSLDASPAQAGIIKIDQELITNIEKIEGVVKTSPRLQVTTQVNIDELTSDIETLLIEPSFLEIEGIEAAKGDLVANTKEMGVTISSSLAKIFKKEPEEMLNKEIKLSFFIPKDSAETTENEEGEISALGENVETEAVKVNDSFKIIGYIEQETPIMYVNIKDVKKYTQIPYYSSIKVKCQESTFLDPVKEKLLSIGLVVSSLSETVEQANQVFKVIQIILALFGIIALIVSAIGMFNTMTVTLLERTEEIGIMKSIGVSENDILLMFVFESSIMGFFGGLSGVTLGFLGGKLFNFGLNLLAQKLGGEAISLFYSPLWFVILIVALAAIVGFFTGLIPARRASSIDPLDALRYK